VVVLSLWTACFGVCAAATENEAAAIADAPVVCKNFLRLKAILDLLLYI
jgi:hypothetical protein